jgi:hypothetical protein
MAAGDNARLRDNLPDILDLFSVRARGFNDEPNQRKARAFGPGDRVMDTGRNVGKGRADRARAVDRIGPGRGGSEKRPR